MPDSNKSEWVGQLRQQLKQAEEREERWRGLGRQLRRTSRELWDRIAYPRQLEVESLKVLIEQAEARHE